MKWSAAILFTLAAGCTLMFCACGQSTGGSDAGPLSFKGKSAAEVALKSLDGKDYTLSAMKGKVVVIDCWATWCPPCRLSLPHLQKVSDDKALADKGLVVWAVNEEETQAEVESFLKTNKYTFTVLMDDKGIVLKDYLISGIPTTLIVGRDGIVKDAFVGFRGEETAKALDEAINKALAEPVSAANK